jgi:hypothetical protein
MVAAAAQLSGLNIPAVSPHFAILLSFNTQEVRKLGDKTLCWHRFGWHEEPGSSDKQTILRLLSNASHCNGSLQCIVLMVMTCCNTTAWHTCLPPCILVRTASKFGDTTQNILKTAGSIGCVIKL